MKSEIFIVTFKRDFPYLLHCLRSVQKFFDRPNVRILVPHSDVGETRAVSELAHCPTNVVGFDEWPERGMIHHMYQIMHADQWCNDADIIIHFDPDCIFTAPVSAETYSPNGKPILRYETFGSIGKRHPQVFDKWRDTCNKCLPFDCKYEAMRCHPLVYHRGLYALARQLMEKKTGQSCEKYIQAQQNAFPQGFCEFNTLGNVALEFFPTIYERVEQTGDLPNPENHVIQFWSHGPIDKPQDIWLEGKQQKVVPLEKIKQVLG